MGSIAFCLLEFLHLYRSFFRRELMPWIGELRDLRQNRRKLTNPTAKIVQPHESVETVLVRVNTFAASSWSWAICASIIGRFSSIARRGQIACETPSAKRKGQVFGINPIFVDVLTEGRGAPFPIWVPSN